MSWLSLAILESEARRTTRRAYLFAYRTAYAALMVGVLMAGYWTLLQDGLVTEISQLAHLGRELFVWVVRAQLLLVLLIAPLATASSVLDETSEGTTELLLLTRLRPEQILGAKLLLRVTLVLSAVMGALPVWLLGVGLGGVGPLEVAAAITHTITVVAVMGALGAFLALFTRRLSLVVLASLVYAVLFFGLGPWIYVAITHRAQDLVRFSPFASTRAQELSALCSPLSFLPSLLVMLALAAPAYHRTVYGRDLELPFVEDWHRRAWHFVMTGPLALIGQALVPVMAWVFDLWLWATFSLATALATWAFLQNVGRLLVVLEQVGAPKLRVNPKLGWRPMLWLELRDLQDLVAVAGQCALALILALPVAVKIGMVHELAMALIVGALLLGVWAGAGSFVEDEREGTLSLLLVTTLPSWEIVLGKLAGAIAPSVPLLFMAWPLLIWRWDAGMCLWTLSLLVWTSTAAAALGHAGWFPRLGVFAVVATVLAVLPVLAWVVGHAQPVLGAMVAPLWGGPRWGLEAAALHAVWALGLTAGLTARLRG